MRPPDHPRDLVYPALDWRPPDREALHVLLDPGLPLFRLRDPTLPAMRASVLLRAGSAYDPEGRTGLAEWTAAAVRTAGAGGRSGDEVDRHLETLGASLSMAIGPTCLAIHLHVPTGGADEAMAILADLVLRPRLEPTRIETERARFLARIRHRNDHPGAVLDRLLRQRIYGNHPVAAHPTRTGIEGLTREDAVAFHRARWGPAGAALAVSGDVPPGWPEETLVRLLDGWRGDPAPPLPPVTASTRPGIVLVPRAQAQGWVRLGHLCVPRTAPDFEALEVANHLLGGGAFTSRLMSRIRSEEGLAYSIRSRVEYAVGWPGLFAIDFQCRSDRVARTGTLVVGEIHRIRDEVMGEEELAGAKAALIESFPETFATPHETVLAFARATFEGLPPDHLQQTLARTEAVNADEVRRAARTHLRPEDLCIIVVGDADAIRQGDPARPERLEDLGPVSVETLETTGG